MPSTVKDFSLTTYPENNKTNQKHRSLHAPYMNKHHLKNYLLKINLLIGTTTFMLSSCSERFSHTVQQVPAPPGAVTANVPDYSDSTIVVAAGKHYDRSKLHTFFYGKHYRPAWTTPVEVEVLDIGTAKGGLKPLQLGGSRQTINLRLEDSAGTEYVLRSLDKEPASALPENWQKSYIANIARDATSATHPYAALTLPPMLEALNIYHAKPELVYVPHDPRLGEYLDDIGGMVALLEKRPAGDQSNNPAMGNAEKVTSTQSMLEDRVYDNDTRVDARYFLRARLFDMLIGDWSRHEDNWRWAEFKQDSILMYRAIPRDRDNVFYKLNDALIPWIFMRTGLKSHFQTFRPKIKNLADLNKSGYNLDKIILAELSLQDWQEVADSVQKELTDDVIEKAFRRMPDTIYEITAPSIMAKLKSRRAQLPAAAASYYKYLSCNAVVVGSDKHELFEVNVLSDNQVQVQVYKTKKDGDVKYLFFDRVYDANITQVIQLYGLDGNDQFVVKGEAAPKIEIKIWGGAGEDDYTVSTENKKLAKKIEIEDSMYRNTYDVAKKTKVTVNDNPAANKYIGEGWLLRYYLN